MLWYKLFLMDWRKALVLAWHKFYYSDWALIALLIFLVAMVYLILYFVCREPTDEDEFYE